MKYGLIGEKLGHSFSKEIHHRLADYSYELVELSPAQLDAFLTKRDFSGINVTIPYKEAVIPYLDAIDETAQKIGAVNTISNRDGQLIGYNTDYLGLKALIQHANLSLQNKKVLILGSGGTSKTALAVAKDCTCRQVIRVSRSAKDTCITYTDASLQHSDAQIIINTTPCGMYPQIGESAINLDDFPALEGVIDIIYNPLQSKLVCDALQRGITAVGGLYMLVAQAAFASEIFIGKPISGDCIDQIYQQTLKDKRNLVLIGMPGCGKTTIGKTLAEQLHLDYVDTDDACVLEDGRSVVDIITQEGEPYFRRLESSVVRTCAARQHCVIATGGGAVLDPENVSLLRENGRLYFIDRPLDLLCATPDRPLSSTREALGERYAERQDLYQSVCDVHVSAKGTIEEVVDQIRKDLSR